MAGIHLSGPNSPKTSIVIMTGQFLDGNLKMSYVFEKIAAFGTLFSDDRLYELLKLTSPEQVFVDCPLSEPPCVACSRPLCPGVSACEDMAVAMMQAIANSSSKTRKRPLNPQTQRLWDVVRNCDEKLTNPEPSYSANLAPLQVRAKTLQRRLNCLDTPIRLQETHVGITLESIVEKLGLEKKHYERYRSFDDGKQLRSEILEALYRKGWLALDKMDEVESSTENFHAMITALVAALYQAGLCLEPKNDFSRKQGWVYIPDPGRL